MGLMNDEGMDSFLGYMVYRMMQTSTFRQELYLAGKTNAKNVAARRKLKLKMHAIKHSGARLDGLSSHTGDVVYTVSKLEERETRFGETVQKMLLSLSDIMKSINDLDARHNDYKLTDRLRLIEDEALQLRQLLHGYELRHDQRNQDLQHMIASGTAPEDLDRKIHDRIFRVRFETECGPTTFLLDGTQITDFHDAPEASRDYLLRKSTGLVRRQDAIRDGYIHQIADIPPERLASYTACNMPTTP